MVDVPDDAQAAVGPDLGARVAELESCQGGTGGRAGGPAAGTADGPEHAAVQAQALGPQVTSYVGCVAPESATRDAMLAHGTGGGVLG